MTRLLSLWLILVALAPTAQAIDVNWPLQGQNTASGTFHQTVTDINGAVAFSSTGRFAALKPHHFRWEIESPDRQLLIATLRRSGSGIKIWTSSILRDAPEIEDLPISAIWNGTVDRTSSEEPGRFGDEVKNLPFVLPMKIPSSFVLRTH